MLVLAMPASGMAATYSGADACQTCHAAIHGDVFLSGHPYKLNKIEGAAPTYPTGVDNSDSVQVPNVWAGATWDSATYVIGGYNWKARFLDENGWIVTGDAVQYNLATQGWVGYHSDEARGTKPYTCGTCHTTGWVADTSENHDDLSLHQDSLAGIWGTFSEPGITCEGCHGAGSDHVASPSTANIERSSTDRCGDCHSRGDQAVLDVSGGLIKHHEQYEEIIRNVAPHDDCMTCHDPHKSTVNELGGLSAQGQSCGDGDAGCHADVELNPAIVGHSEHQCRDCHMSYTSKSATSTGAGVHLAGDLRGHLMKIAVTDKAAADTMFVDGGGAVAGDFVTLDFACLQCHDGNTAPQRDLAWAAVTAKLVHGAGPTADYAGSDACQTCHAAIYDDVYLSGHPYKLNKVDGEPPVYPTAADGGDSVQVPNVWANATWDSATYVIGGYNWKARFLDENGWIVTGDAVQYNLATQGWVGYHSDEARGTKPYNCGACHTTGWVPDESPNHDNLSMHADGLPGIWGVWSETGVTCEACHGPGGSHAGGPSKANIQMADTETCGDCHVRGDVAVIDVKGGLIRHHEQYEEVIRNAAPHDNCMTCHNAHKSTVNELGGLNPNGETCGSGEAGCHIDVPLNRHMAGHDDLQCRDCHMPFTAKNATSTGEGVHLAGDLRGHLMNIIVSDKPAADTMFTADGKDVIGNAISLDFACLQCHDGNTASQQDLTWAAANAAAVHPAPEVAGMSVKDVPNDQGGRVTIRWNASSLDGNVNGMPSYSIWRALPPGVAKTAGGRYRVASVNEATYDWEWIVDQPALKLLSYSYTARTLYDSTAASDGMHHFMVVAHTSDADAFFKSQAASGYSVDNLAPARLGAPKLVANRVVWNQAPEADVQHYAVYRTVFRGGPGFGDEPYLTTVDTSFAAEWPYRFGIAAVDFGGNEGELSVIAVPTAVGSEAPLPTSTALIGNAPNPFNPETVIRYQVHAEASVSISVYNARGQHVRTLLAGNTGIGAHSVIWDGKDSAGHDVASGLYIYSMTTNTGTRDVRRMLLVR